ncbi:DEAD/DEAH box helicase [Desulfosarcina alkanivorans]|uniref:DEAD/DEAH box helicase n=1 Tax=Desulfosarcina alkanivorans TaxID=571177 RepID=A0A5K7YHT0_9BACT|nr:DEAD/DEAH box helicase [Desulfosarcina alkanivorans]BBO66291.1 DEAD/DEAH box helicase [Desulfosarcina alkanivorans]
MPTGLDLKLETLYERLIVHHVRHQLPGNALSEDEAMSQYDYNRLMSFASWLALKEDQGDQAKAYEIATRTAEMIQNSNEPLLKAAAVILSRLGNFPGRQLLQKRFNCFENKKDSSSMYLGFETIARECENTVEVTPNKPFLLTNFQKRLFDGLSTGLSLSVSAPTSAGKSFVLCLDTIRRLRENAGASIVFVVPTRALIRQIADKISRELKEAGLSQVPVRCVPLPIERSEAKCGIVYVLTQERLLSLLFSDQGQQWITTLIIDEAQGVKDGSRGILLQSAIEEVHDRFPTAEIIFSSPLIRNPEYLLMLFNTSDSGAYFTEIHSPVSQNIILLSDVKGKPSQANFELLMNSKRADLGLWDLTFRLRGPKFVQQAALARAITQKNDCTILYANFPKNTEKLADALLSDDSNEIQIEQEVLEFIDFLKEHIHPKYPLINHLPHGVAYHYGFMPGIVRSRVEDLFISGKLRFICCTSTLLQGVNLPARNIIIENPRKGLGVPMQRGDFLNLAGRAGRLLEEFHGNIWCIRGDEWDLPEGSNEPCFQGEILQEVSSAFEKVLSDGGTLVQKTLDGEVLPEKENDLAIGALGKLFADFIQVDKDLDTSRYSNDNNKEKLKETKEKCAAIKVDMPNWVFKRNPTIHPARLQQLHDHLIIQPDIEEWIPLLPHETGFNMRMKRIFRAVEINLSLVDNESYTFDAWLASQWVHDQPLRAIIENQIRRKNDPPRDVIYDILDALENRIRYRYVKHTRAYQDVLIVILEDSGKSDLIETVRPLHLFLECGASSTVALNLMSLGISRTTSLLLKGVIQFPEESSPEECFDVLRRINLNNLNISSLCKRELINIVGSKI